MNARINKLLGILQCSATQQINVIEVKPNVQILSGDRLLLELSDEEFDEMTVHEILEKAGVPMK